MHQQRSPVASLPRARATNPARLPEHAVAHWITSPRPFQKLAMLLK
jgi:hypothetical protein